MIFKPGKIVRILAASLLLGSAPSSVWAAATSGRATASSVSAEKVVRYIRDHFNIPDSVKVAADPLRASVVPEYYETIVNVDDGNPQHKKTQPVSVSKDGHYLILGNVYELGAGDKTAEIVQDVRQAFKVPPTAQLKVGQPQASAFPSFDKIRVTASDGNGRDFYLSKNNRTLVLGDIYLLNLDARRAISTLNAPSVGPPHAPVTIVEYADLECPSCARMHEFLEKELLPKYSGKVRVVFKEFPLPMHQWAFAGSIANECAYQIEPSKFFPYRSLIFQHQSDVDAVQTDPTKVRDMLLNYGEQVGLDRTKLAMCMDSEASKSRVEMGHHEGETLSVNSTPTFFVNGKILVGVISAADFYKAVDEALKTAK